MLQAEHVVTAATTRAQGRRRMQVFRRPSAHVCTGAWPCSASAEGLTLKPGTPACMSWCVAALSDTVGMS